MKNILLVFVAVLFVAQVNAQNSATPLPKEGVVVRASQNTIEVKVGETVTVDLQVIRSKTEQKKLSPVKLSAQLPKGIELTIEPNPMTNGNGKATFAIGQDVIPGNYTITLQKAENSILKVVGTIIVIKVVSTSGNIEKAGSNE